MLGEGGGGESKGMLAVLTTFESLLVTWSGRDLTLLGGRGGGGEKGLTDDECTFA